MLAVEGEGVKAGAKPNAVRSAIDIIAVVRHFADSAPGMVQKDWYDLVGFSLGCETGIERLSETIALARRKSLNPGVSIIAGGAIFGLHPEYGDRLAADAIVTDGPSAPALAEKLLADNLARQRA